MKIMTLLLFALSLAHVSQAQNDHEADIITTSAGELTITFLGHGTLMFSFDGRIIHVDPFSRVADYSKLPDADLILITHEHGDHLDMKAIGEIRTDKTEVILTEICRDKCPGEVMKNGDATTALGLNIQAVPAYNIIHKRDNGSAYHPKGNGNGYIITFADTKVYVAGDSENTAEMKALKDIDIAFLPMNLPYTMTPEMVADAAMAFRPGILYPYHFGSTDTSKLTTLLKNETDIEVRIRKLQ